MQDGRNAAGINRLSKRRTFAAVVQKALSSTNCTFDMLAMLLMLVVESSALRSAMPSCAGHCCMRAAEWRRSHLQHASGARSIRRSSDEHTP